MSRRDSFCDRIPNEQVPRATSAPVGRRPSPQVHAVAKPSMRAIRKSLD
jgi:hypothetical protein